MRYVVFQMPEYKSLGAFVTLDDALDAVKRYMVHDLQERQTSNLYRVVVIEE